MFENQNYYLNAAIAAFIATVGFLNLWFDNRKQKAEKLRLQKEDEARYGRTDL